MFQSFFYERAENSDDPEVRFFDESIAAKISRSKKAALGNMGRGKKNSTFLNDTTADTSTEVSKFSLRCDRPVRSSRSSHLSTVFATCPVELGTSRRWSLVSVRIVSTAESTTLRKD
jgi:hypothetical protein